MPAKGPGVARGKKIEKNFDLKKKISAHSVQQFDWL